MRQKSAPLPYSFLFVPRCSSDQPLTHRAVFLKAGVALGAGPALLSPLPLPGQGIYQVFLWMLTLVLNLLPDLLQAASRREQVLHIPGQAQPLPLPPSSTTTVSPWLWDFPCTSVLASLSSCFLHCFKHSRSNQGPARNQLRPSRLACLLPLCCAHCTPPAVPLPLCCAPAPLLLLLVLHHRWVFAPLPPQGLNRAPQVF